MSRRISMTLSIAVMLGWLAWLPLAVRADSAVPDSGALKARVMAALGGARRLEAFRSVRATGTMEGVSGFPGTYEMEAQAPGRRSVTWDIRYLRQTTAIDGDAGWERSGAVRELAGEELSRERRGARFNVLFALLKHDAPFTVDTGACGPGKPAYLLRFASAGELAETFGIDRQSYLPLCHSRMERYEEGSAEVRTDYADYRAVHGVMLPYSIREKSPDNELNIVIGKYEVNTKFDPSMFRNPEMSTFGEPIVLELATLPANIYREQDGRYTSGAQRYWGMYYYPTESWSLDLMVKEKHGRYLEPELARADLYSGSEKVASQEWGHSSLLMLRRYPISRFTPQGEIYGFRHNFTVANTENIDHMIYTLEAKAADGQIYSGSVDVPITTYQSKTGLIFPMKGKFLVTSGHEYYEKEHKYERSQQFAIDIVALGENFEFARNNGAAMTDYVGYARREIIAPAAGRVAFARNDIPDGAVKSAFLKMDNGITAPAGNVVIIDHGHNEFSVFCHMHFGSVRVKTGDHVQQGEVIGLLGAAGSPGLPHLHYQLQAGPNIFGDDGLPLAFSNIERVAWLGQSGSEDERGAAPVSQPRAGVFMEAK